MMTRPEHSRAGEASRIRVVCLGETMLMFAPAGFETIEYCDQFTAFNGGAESNVAIGLERLGIHSGWIGKLPDNSLGHKIVNEIRSLGVDTSAVVWSKNGRVGTFFVEWGAPPVRPLRTIYDRAGSAASTLDVEDLDWSYIGDAEWLVLSGITPALSKVCYRMICAVVEKASECGVKIAFDVNYRALLWDRGNACTVCTEILPHIDLLVGTEADLRLLCNNSLNREEILRYFVDMYQMEAAVMTLGSEGALAHNGQQAYTSTGHPVRTVNRLGAGDAFLAGLLYGYMHRDLYTGLQWGLAMSALKLTIPQNIPLVNKEDVERLVAGDAGILVLR